ncbi:hypothetical protein JCM10207_002234, partial [Rhodosporidiobolus poonsookiae]
MRFPRLLRTPSSSSSSRPTRLPLHVLGDEDDDDQHRDSRLSRDEATIPLTTRDYADPDTHYPPASSSLPKRSTSSSSSPYALLARLPIRRILVAAILLVGLWKLHRWTENNTTVYDKLHHKLDSYSQRYNPWHPQPTPLVWVDQPKTVAVQGRRYRAHLERKDDLFLGWKAVPYAQPPLGDRRFRNAVPLEDVDPAREKERVMDRWDEGCVRPRPRSDGKDGPKEHFDGHEDCLKLNIFTPLQRPNNTLLPVMV